MMNQPWRILRAFTRFHFNNSKRRTCISITGMQGEEIKAIWDNAIDMWELLFNVCFSPMLSNITPFRGRTLPYHPIRIIQIYCMNSSRDSVVA